MPIQIAISLCSRTPLTASHLKKTARKVLRLLSVRSADLSIACVSGRTMQALNRKYRKHDYATDVLAFDLCDSRSSNARYLTGEIIISVDAARQNVRLYNTTLRQELTLYLIHGILHLVGYDDRNPPAAARMHRRQQQVLTRIER